MTAWRATGSKYRAARTEYNGRHFDSRFEAGVARDLDLRIRAGEIAGWEPQFHVVCTPHRADGTPVPSCAIRHRVDFRVHLLDGTYELLEAKGFETADYKLRRRWLLEFWLPQHPDHTYRVVKDRGRAWTLPGAARASRAAR